MSNQKYKLFYQLMMDQNKQAFVDFKKIHDGFQKNAAEWEEKFHTEGRDILDIIRDWERRLCSGMERGQYAGYSSKLSEKFWEEVKKYLPLIDEVGVRVKKDRASSRLMTNLD